MSRRKAWLTMSEPPHTSGLSESRAWPRLGSAMRTPRDDVDRHAERALHELGLDAPVARDHALRVLEGERAVVPHDQEIHDHAAARARHRERHLRQPSAD